MKTFEQFLTEQESELLAEHLLLEMGFKDLVQRAKEIAMPLAWVVALGAIYTLTLGGGVFSLAMIALNLPAAYHWAKSNIQFAKLLRDKEFNEFIRTHTVLSTDSIAVPAEDVEELRSIVIRVLGNDKIIRDLKRFTTALDFHK